MPKTAEFIEESKSLKPEKTSKRGMHPNSRANLRPYVAGQSGNPGGKPKIDVAAVIARAILEQNQEAAYKGLGKALIKGNAYVFKELAERGYGKLTEKRELKYVHEEESDDDLNAQIAALERKLGLARAIDDASAVGIAKAGASAANGHAKDHDLLPR